MVVLFFPTSFRLFIISISVCESKELVGSSHNKIGAFLRIARAIATLCFSPPDNFKPLSPTIVSYPSGKVIIVSCICAFFAA
mmetsp:Transcript_25789/g.31795  ORF Transcript_25789/g.31795 Transcript_25789/m.31795 type:complete len:82 (-) Transcript_25789:2049-2294(-)